MLGSAVAGLTIAVREEWVHSGYTVVALKIFAQHLLIEPIPANQTSIFVNLCSAQKAP
jgi:hypothetical protein